MRHTADVLEIRVQSTIRVTLRARNMSPEKQRFAAVPLFSRPGRTQAMSSSEAAVIAASRLASLVKPLVLGKPWRQFRGVPCM